MGKNIDLPLSELANGAIQEKLNGELQKVFENIHDPNTSPTAKRIVTIKLEFTPDESRQAVSLKADLTTKPAAVEGVSTTVLTGRDLNNGKVEAKELKSQAPGQTFIDPDDGKFKTDIGTPIEEIVKNNQVIDLQKRG